MKKKQAMQSKHNWYKHIFKLFRFYCGNILHNISYEIYRLSPYILRAYTPHLQFIGIEPTNLCNLRCPICFSQKPILYSPRPKGYMSIDLFKKIIDELANYPYKIQVGLNFGGESLLHKNFLEMLSYAASKDNLFIGFNTNGVLLDEKTVKAILALKDKISSIVISLDGLRSKHEEKRAGSNYQEVEDNIKNFIKLRGDKDLPLISVNLTVSDQTKNEIDEFIEYWTKIVKNVYIYPLLSENIQLLDKNFFSSHFICQKYCTFPFKYMTILWDGKVTSCCHDIAGRNYLGNVNENSIREIWRSKAYVSLRMACVENKFANFNACLKCDAWLYKFIPLKEKNGAMGVNYSGVSKIYEKQ